MTPSLPPPGLYYSLTSGYQGPIARDSAGRCWILVLVSPNIVQGETTEGLSYKAAQLVSADLGCKP
jgi:hypothetical protein